LPRQSTVRKPSLPDKRAFDESPASQGVESNRSYDVLAKEKIRSGDTFLAGRGKTLCAHDHRILGVRGQWFKPVAVPSLRGRSRSQLAHGQQDKEGTLTTSQDLKCLLREHHRLKNFLGGWRDKQLADGTVVWTSPTRVRSTCSIAVLLISADRGRRGDVDLACCRKQHLPKCMVPRSVVIVDAMPQNADGKIAKQCCANS